MADVFLEVEPAAIRAAAEQLTGYPCVSYVACSLGDVDISIQVVGRDNDEIYDFVTGVVAKVPGVHKTTTLIVPLTTQLVADAAPLRIRIPAAGKLKRDSDALVDQVRAIDNARLVQGPLANLLPSQLTALDRALLDVFDLPQI